MQLKRMIITVIAIASMTSAYVYSPKHKHSNKKDIPAVVQETMPSIVSLVIRAGKYKNADLDSILENDHLGNFLNPDYGEPEMQELSVARCSGVIIASNGTIVTNFHCVDRDCKINAIMIDGKIHNAHVIMTEPKIDLALLRIDDTLLHFQPIKIGSSEALQKGEDVMTLGNPHGFSHSVTRGIVANKNIKIGLINYEDYIQTDAPINPGNSGGALINDQGELVGINDANMPTAQSIGFSIPSRILLRMLEEFDTNGKVRFSWFGIKARKVRIGEMRWMCLDGQPRMIVEDLVSKSPVSDKLRKGDVILKIGDDEIHDMDDLHNAGIYQTPHKIVRITFMRDCNIMGINVIPIEHHTDKKVKLGPEPRKQGHK